MITRKELEYVTKWPNRVPYPGRDYCEEAMDKLEAGLRLYKENYANRKYNITFSDQEEIELEILQKNICHMLGIDYTNLTGDYFKNFRNDILLLNPETKINSYDLLNEIISKRKEVLDYDEMNKNNGINMRALNYYKITIKGDMFAKLTDLSNFNFGCINFNKDTYLKVSGKQNYSSNSTRFLYTESNESVSPYFLMGLKPITDDNRNIDLEEEEFTEVENHKYIIETMIAPEHGEQYFNKQTVVIPTQILLDVNGILNKMTATPAEKMKMLKEYRAIITEYDFPNMINIYGDYVSCLMDIESKQKTYKM